MEQYIPKAALLAEIERRMELRNDSYKKYHCISDFIAFEELEYFHDEFIPTLEVKEVDLEKELEKEIELIKGDYEQVDVAWNNDFDYIARYFFELGLKAKDK